jgi:L-ascorbate metabolism protein UlaG (beta-lactamase superfamily)
MDENGDPERTFERKTMSVDIRFLGHAAFTLSNEKHCIAIDPFLTGNPLAEKAGITKESIDPTHIALTHGHTDHVGDTLELATRCGCEILAAFEICEWAAEQGIESVNPGNPGGRFDTDFGWIAFTQAFHSSSFEGRYMGMPCGLVLNIGGVTIYHAGDTALFGDMALIGELYKPDVAILPIGDRFTMGPEHASRAAEMIKPTIAIPCHYGTWDLIDIDPARFKPTGIEVKTLLPGETYTAS